MCYTNKLALPCLALWEKNAFSFRLWKKVLTQQSKPVPERTKFTERLRDTVSFSDQSCCVWSVSPQTWSVYPCSHHYSCCCGASGHPRWGVDVCFFIRTDLEKCIITSLAQQWILCSEWVPSEFESKQLIKKSQVIHTTPVHQFMFFLTSV